MQWSKKLMMSSICALAVMAPSMASAEGGALFDVTSRRAELQMESFAPAYKACMAVPKDKIGDLPESIDGLKTTKGYGSDKRTQKYAWYLMAWTGHAMAGDRDAEKNVANALLSWAKAKGLESTEEVHDSYYALKRVLMPMIVSYSVIQHSYSPEDRTLVQNWLDGLVRRVDKTFNGEVDINNHRYLADSVLMSWGQLTGDDALYAKGIKRYKIALEDARPDGSLPLETRRGARATWYIRHALTSLVVMAEAAALHGDDLYNAKEDGATLNELVNYFLNTVENPLTILPYASENYIPGPSDTFLTQDMTMLKARPHKRHYMAFAEAYITQKDAAERFAVKRMKNMMAAKKIDGERPLIDEYAGGNATCFWWKPNGEALSATPSVAPAAASTEETR